MYTNKHAWTNKDGTYKEVYYYICGRNKQERGHHCDYKASLRKTDIEPLVIEAVKELVSDKYFAKEIEKRIGVQIDTTAIDKELANYESKLKEVDLNKARLEREIDNLPIDARFRERKIHDMTLRLDGLYDTIVELEERIEDAKLRRSSIEMEAITLDNIYKLMLNFGKLYDIISDEEKKNLITYLIKEIQIYPNGESEMPLKSIEFNFPIYRDGQEVRRLLWEKGNTVDSVFLLDKRTPSFTELKKGSEQFQIITCPCEGTLADFCRAAKERSEAQTSFLEPSSETDDLIYISCLPWFDLTCCTNERQVDIDDAIPRITWGKYIRQENGRETLGLSIEVNHRLVDGVHLGRFYESLQNKINELE